MLCFFLQFRDGLGNIYGEVFGEGGNENADNEQRNFSEKWGWYSTIEELTGGDVTKIETVVGLNMHTCLNNLCYKIDKARKEKEQLRQQQLRNGR